MTLAAALWWAVVAAEACALVGAVGMSSDFSPSSERTKPEATAGALVALLAYALAADVAMAAIEARLAGQARPFVGTARALYHVHTALVLGWPAALAAATWATFAPARALSRRALAAVLRALPPESIRHPSPPRPKLEAWQLVGAVWASWAASMAGLHPMTRLDTARCLRLAQAAGIVACVVAIVRAWRQPWSRAAVAVGLLVAVEVALALLGPWAHDVFRDWPRLARVPYVLGFVGVGAVVWTGRRGAV